jgi:predicted ATPase/class 3 adenylate cyclase
MSPTQPPPDLRPGESPPAAAITARTGTETFLFADIEGSTRLLQLLGDGYGALLLEQRRLLLSAIESAGGREVSNAGDGSFAVFPSARDAVLAAAAAQRALSSHAWPDGAVVRVRMGLHTGEPGMAGGIYTGLDVHRAARIAAAGHGGQVLLSEATRQLVERDLPAGLGLRDLGEHRLRDLQRAERLWQLVIEDLPAEFAALRSLSTRPNNLPLQATPFVGRGQEIETVRQIVLREDVRLVTLTGPGGMGKTRLALQTAAGVVDRFADGVFVVELGAVQDPAMIGSRIAASLGVAENAARPVLDSVTDHLRHRELLLVLDNFEQVVAGAPVVAELLHECPRLKTLVTSRIVLHLSGEYEYQVPPLPVPDPKRPAGFEALAAYAGVALFVQRAQAVRPDFVLDAENASAVARICASLEGLPLAIELAAARIKLFSPQAMVARLSSRLDLLKGGARDLPARQQTLRQAIAWSYDLLEPDERAYFRRFAAFSGGASLDAIEQVCNGEDDLVLDPLDAIASLIDNSLLRRFDDDRDEPRFVMLETIREYGLECLRDNGEEATLRRAHALYFLQLAEQAEPELTTSRQRVWLERLETEHDNLRTALEWTAEHHEADIGLRFGAALWRFFISLGHLREGHDWLERLLALPGAHAPTAERARVLLGAGTMLHALSEYASSRARLDESLMIWRELGDKHGQATVLNNLAWIAGNFHARESRPLAEEALALMRELGDKRGTAVALHNLSWVSLMEGEIATAHSLTEQAMALRREAGDTRGAAYMQVNLADIEMLQGDYAAAKAHAEAGLATLRELGDRQIGAWAIQVIGRIANAEGRREEALANYEESHVLWVEVGNEDARGWNLADTAKVLAELGEIERASALANEGLALARRTGNAISLALTLPIAAAIALEQGDDATAAALLDEAFALFEATSHRMGLIPTLESAAQLRATRGEFVAAARLLGHADELRTALGMPVAPGDRDRHERLLNAVRDALGDA